MRMPLSLPLLLSSVTLLSACGPGGPAADIDPRLGQACLDLHRDRLPPGTQFEGVEFADADRIEVRAMTGVELVTLRCARAPDGSPAGPLD